MIRRTNSEQRRAYLFIRGNFIDRERDYTRERLKQLVLCPA